MRLMTLLLALAGSVTLTAMPLHAKDPAQDTVSVAGSDGKEEKLECRRVDTLGSRVRGPKVCRTKEEWRLEESNAQQNVREMQRNKNSTNGS